MLEHIRLHLLQGVPNDQIAKYLKGKYVNVYVPTTPNPTSGYTLIVPTKKIIEIDLSVDQVSKVCNLNGCINNR